MKQKSPKKLAEKKVKVIADYREVPSRVIDELTRLGVEVEARQLKVGDFILSDRVGVERKSVSDFIQSIIDKRLLDQAERLSKTYERPMMILEGENLYTRRAIHPNAIRGALAAIAVDFQIPILQTLDEVETAELLVAIAKREQVKEAREVAIRPGPKGLTLPMQQRFIVEGLPGVSAVLAKRLLNHFKSVERVMCAADEELRQVRGIGREKAKKIRQVLSSSYEGEGT